LAFIKIATPISHLFSSEDIAKKISVYSDCFEGRETSPAILESEQELFHCDLSIVCPWNGKEENILLEIRKNRSSLNIITFHVASCYCDPTIQNGMFFPNGNKMKPEEMVVNTVKNLEKIRSIYPSGTKIGLENNNYFPTGAYETVTEGSFLSELITNNGLFFLLDIAHAQITSTNNKIGFSKYMDSLPLGKLLQIHTSMFKVRDDGIAIDSHELPSEELIETTITIANKHNAQYITPEYYKDLQKLFELLKTMREKLHNGYNEPIKV
jgi:uncharacterized protein (UPF0276 family)